MSSRAARTLAHAIRHGAQRHEEKQGRKVYRGAITSLTPLGVDLLDVDLSLDDQDIDLSQEVRRYSQVQGLKIGDVLALLEVATGDFIATSVVSDDAVVP